MGKLKLSKRDVKAVKDSIAHWKRDVRAKLKKGIKIKDKGDWLVWVGNLEYVKCQADRCPLCRIYYNNTRFSLGAACPYYKKYGASCTATGYGSSFVGHWRRFRRNPCLETCNGMIKALENILK